LKKEEKFERTRYVRLCNGRGGRNFACTPGPPLEPQQEKELDAIMSAAEKEMVKRK
jgi:hypothetical protein